MNFLAGLVIFFIAGAMNGSFALPSKHLTKWSHQRIWLHYSCWAFLLFPILSLIILSPKAFSVYAQTSTSTLEIILTGGFLFAIGQLCFAKSLESIGLSLGFVINISIGTALGSLIPLFTMHNGRLLTPQGIAILSGVALILLGVLVSYIAGYQRDKNNQHNSSTKSNYLVGVIFAALAGVFSAGQNITFSYTHHLQEKALSLGISTLMSANIIWPAFLAATFIPYAAYMLYLRIKNSDVEIKHRSAPYYIATIVMGAFWYFSLILYSAASLKIGNLGPVIGWPLFMVCIILTANLWGFRHGEWSQALPSTKRLAKLSIGILILSIFVLAYATFLSMH